MRTGQLVASSVGLSEYVGDGWMGLAESVAFVQRHAVVDEFSTGTIGGDDTRRSGGSEVSLQFQKHDLIERVLMAQPLGSATPEHSLRLYENTNRVRVLGTEEAQPFPTNTGDPVTALNEVANYIEPPIRTADQSESSKDVSNLPPEFGRFQARRTQINSGRVQWARESKARLDVGASQVLLDQPARAKRRSWQSGR